METPPPPGFSSRLCPSSSSPMETPPPPPGFSSRLCPSSSSPMETPPPPPPPPGFSSRLCPSSSSPVVPDLSLGIPRKEPKLEPLDEEDEARVNSTDLYHLTNPISLPSSTTTVTSGETPKQERGQESVPSPNEDDPLSCTDSIEDFFTAGSDGMQSSNNSTWDLIPAPAGSLTAMFISTKTKKPPRSGDMVRVAAIGHQDKLYYRNLVLKTRAMYESLRISFLSEGEKISGGQLKCQPNYMAASALTNQELLLNRDRRVIGAIPGIHVGDIFFFRMELLILGLHGQPQAGIDYVGSSQSSNGEPIATSIVVSGGYEDDEDTGDVIIYTGHGGKVGNSSKHSVSQKLEAGNLALERSMNYGIEIRVIRGFKFIRSPSGKIYTYDGLYKVVKYWKDVGKSGCGVYKYKLVRVAGQEEMGSKLLELAQDRKEQLLNGIPPGYLNPDISMGKEKLPVTLFNDIDVDTYPMHFEYLARPVYSHSAREQINLKPGGGGCLCVSNCSENCSCAEKNGGDFAYDSNGILLMGKPLIHECGRSCLCPPTCQNRVSQKGLRHRLEVFRSRETGWGVRSLDLIQAGSFVCEFTGIVLTQQQSKLLSPSDSCLIYPSRFPNRWWEWGNLSEVFPGYLRRLDPPLPQVSFSVDVSQQRNVACYLGHSICPNLFVQFVLYDHNDISYPHLMIFAMENIAPMKELSIDYGLRDTTLDSEAIVVKSET